MASVSNLTDYTTRAEEPKAQQPKKKSNSTKTPDNSNPKTTTVSIHTFNACPINACPSLGKSENASSNLSEWPKTITQITASSFDDEEAAFDEFDESRKREYLQQHQDALDQKIQKNFLSFLELKLSDLAGFKARFELHDITYQNSLNNSKTPEFQTNFWDLRTNDTANYGSVKNDWNGCKAIFEERIAQLNKAIAKYEFQSLFLEYIKGCDGLLNSWWQGSKGYRFGSAYRMGQIDTDLTAKKVALGIKPEDLASIDSGSTSNSNSEGELAVVDQLFQLDCDLVILKEEVTIFNEFLKKISLQTLKDTNYAQLFYDEHKQNLEDIKAGFAALKQKAIPERLRVLDEQIALKSSNIKSEEYQTLDLEKAKFPVSEVEIQRRIAEVEAFLLTRKTTFTLVDSKPDTDEKTSGEKATKKEHVKDITPTIIFETQNADLAFLARIVKLKEKIKLSSQWDAKLTPEQRKAEFLTFFKEEKALKEEVEQQERRRSQIATAANIYKSYITALTLGKSMVEENLKTLDQLNAARSSWQVNKTAESAQVTSTTTTTTTSTSTSSSSTATPVAAAAKK